MRDYLMSSFSAEPTCVPALPLFTCKPLSFQIISPHNGLDNQLKSWHKWTNKPQQHLSSLYSCLSTGIGKSILTSQILHCSFKSRMIETHNNDVHMKKTTFYCHQMILYNQDSFRGACGNVVYSFFMLRDTVWLKIMLKFKQY